MVRVSVFNNAFKSMYNAEKQGKHQVIIQPSSKVIIKFLLMMQKHEAMANCIASGNGLLPLRESMELPEWTDIVKTGVLKELAPYDPDCFHGKENIFGEGGVIGVGAFQRIYGGRFTSCSESSELIKMAPKKSAKLPAGVSKKKAEKVVNPLFEKRSKQFGIGGALPPKKDLHRFVKWPQVVRIQRKKMILKQRLKVPPPIHQFSKTLDKNLATSLFKMLLKYRPEDRAEKKERLLKRAQAEAEGKTPEVKKPIIVKYGLNHVTYLIEQNKAQLVVIAHDVDPIELVVWLPALCRKMEIPYCIVKGKARLGTIVHKKTASVLCLTSVKNEDKMDFSRILEAIKANFNDKYDENRKKWGGGVMGSKSQAKTKAKERLVAKEAAQRMS
ncbi:unnamed protein product [Fraxinus pennsylvanica]|uniref:Ribosomal protein eL8/eL30/eS12/Gadd45 domain-containing protein n=1 Tax=Fraxinus pennsylvanica TaxID=56036 RepID=A0AAD1ZBH4_9LAMI|nr:unnamed protein product [Fraxinus pennsylvanica]